MEKNLRQNREGYLLDCYIEVDRLRYAERGRIKDKKFDRNSR